MSSPSSSFVEAPEPGQNSALALLFLRFHFRCSEPKCGSALSLKDLKAHLESWLAGAKQIPPFQQLSVVCCSKCENSTCVGCGRRPNGVKRSLNTEMIFTPYGVVNHCCSQGALFGIWVLLARYDNEELQLHKDNTVMAKKPKKAQSSSKPTGVGYSGPGTLGDGLFGDYDQDELEEMEEMMMDGLMDFSSMVQLPAELPDDDQEEEDPDSFMAQILTLLVAFLKPTSTEICETAEDILVLLRHSVLFNAVTALMRNDSITEMTRRRPVYEAAFEFLQAIISYGLSLIIIEPRRNNQNSPGLQALCQGAGTSHSNQNDQDLSTSLFECTKNTYRQAKVYLELSTKSAQNSPKKASIRLCTILVDLYTQMHTLCAIVGRSDTSAVDIGDAWTKYAEENRVTFDDDVLFIHSFPTAKGSIASDSQRGRLSRIGKEIANMTTSLPVGIFLKVAESRSDLMKALIVGPEGSPYAGGLFPFDIYLDANYPLTPPKIKFVLPGNHTGMNPNLHPGGTVCLSLLNTWNGGPQERWQPAKSTILAALVSIQAMILGAPLPWLNEPGFENQGDSPRALEYNLEIQCKTVKYGMLSWLKKPVAADAAWTEVSHMYWKCNGAKVLQSVQEWKVANKMLTKFNLRAMTAQPHLHHHHQPPPSKKSKPKVEERGENLVDMLTDGLGLRKPEASEPPVEPPAAGKGKRRSQGSSDGGAKRVKSAEGGSMNASTSDDRWRYIGPHDIKTVRVACDEVGCRPAKSIKESIERLEKFVKDADLMHSVIAGRWGEVLVGGAPVRLDDEDDSDL